MGLERHRGANRVVGPGVVTASVLLLCIHLFAELIARVVTHAMDFHNFSVSLQIFIRGRK
eukprot:scaffold563389_cov36-Prasinocladus_malaysianus.AAC.1